MTVFSDYCKSNTLETGNRSTIIRGGGLGKNRLQRQRRGLSGMMDVPGTSPVVVTKCLTNNLRKEGFEGTGHHGRGRQRGGDGRSMRQMAT